MPIGVGGVLYPPTFFDSVEFGSTLTARNPFFNPIAFSQRSSAVGHSSLIFSKSNSTLSKNGFRAVKVDPNSKEWFTIVSSQKQALMKTNVGQNMNDVSISNLQKFYKIKLYQDDEVQ